MKQYLIIIKADTNDGDYVYRMVEVDAPIYDREYRERLVRIGKALSETRGTWGKGDQMDDGNDPFEVYKDTLSEEDIEWFNERTPSGEYGIHTVEAVTVYDIAGKTIVF